MRVPVCVAMGRGNGWGGGGGWRIHHVTKIECKSYQNVPVFRAFLGKNLQYLKYHDLLTTSIIYMYISSSNSVVLVENLPGGPNCPFPSLNYTCGGC